MMVLMRHLNENVCNFVKAESVLCFSLDICHMLHFLEPEFNKKSHLNDSKQTLPNSESRI